MFILYRRKISIIFKHNIFSPPDGGLVAGVVIGILAGIIAIVAIMVVVWVRVIRTDSTAFLHDDTTKQRAQLYRYVCYIYIYIVSMTLYMFLRYFLSSITFLIFIFFSLYIKCFISLILNC